MIINDILIIFHVTVSGENSVQDIVECLPDDAATVSYQIGGMVFITINKWTNCQLEVVVSSAETDYYTAATAECVFNRIQMDRGLRARDT